MNRCSFCYRIMDVEDRRLAGLTFFCPGCHYQEGPGGIERLPDPDHLRREASELEQLADDIEQGNGLAGRLKEFAR